MQAALQPGAVWDSDWDATQWFGALGVVVKLVQTLDDSKTADIVLCRRSGAAKRLCSEWGGACCSFTTTRAHTHIPARQPNAADQELAAAPAVPTVAFSSLHGVYWQVAGSLIGAFRRPTLNACATCE